jgi:hypothetical protein
MEDWTAKFHAAVATADADMFEICYWVDTFQFWLKSDKYDKTLNTKTQNIHFGLGLTEWGIPNRVPPAWGIPSQLRNHVDEFPVKTSHTQTRPKTPRPLKGYRPQKILMSLAPFAKVANLANTQNCVLCVQLLTRFLLLKLLPVS